MSNAFSRRATGKEKEAKAVAQSSELVTTSDAPVNVEDRQKKPGELSPSPLALSPAKVPWSPWLAVVYAVVVFRPPRP